MNFGEWILKGPVRDIPTSSIPQIFDDLLESRPELKTKAAFMDDDQRLVTYQDVQHISDRIAKSLHQCLGVLQGSS